MEYTLTVFTALSDPIRLRSLALLAGQGELCVCELTQAMQVSQPTVSKHMATLRQAGLVQVRRDAQWVLYSLPASLPAWVRSVLAAALAEVSVQPVHATDLARLQNSSRPLRRCSA